MKPALCLLALMALGAASPLHGKEEKAEKKALEKARIDAIRERLTPLIEAGKRAPLLEAEATYRFGWSGLTAAKGKMIFSVPKPGEARLDVEVGTSGAARTLWRMDAEYFSIVDGRSALPLRSRQVETYKKKTTLTGMEFTPEQVWRSKGDVASLPDDFRANRTLSRDELRDLTGKKPKRTRFPEFLDLHSALWQVRSQPLKEGDVYRFVIFQDSPYLATIRVWKREKLNIGAGRFDAVRLDCALVWLDKEWQPQRHKRFKRASGWLSDDERRLPLKLEAEVFIGSVWAEMESLKMKE